MDERSILRNAIKAVEPNKTRILSKHQNFTPPSSVLAPEVRRSELPQVDPTRGSLPQVELPQGKDPWGELHQGNSSQGEVRHDDFSKTPPQGFDLDRYQSDRKQKRRESMVKSAIEGTATLSVTVQKALVKSHLAGGWGRLAHSIVQQLKAPTRYGLKLVDVAVILTIYDRTIALVDPTMFAPITAEEFEAETGMDNSNVRAALRELQRREIVVRIPYKTVNFWGLNHSYFELVRKGESTRGKPTRGNLPQGNAPGVNQGCLPQVEEGQITPSGDASSSGNSMENSLPQNLNQESLKESLSGSSVFPDDMRSRWMNFERNGLGSKAKNEREIFNRLFMAHGKPFFDACWNVISFLEEHGTGKRDSAEKIHSPMVWIDGHWETNVTRYQNWMAKKQNLEEAHAKRLEKEAKKRFEQHEQDKQVAREKEEDKEWEAKLASDSKRFLEAYPFEEERNAFIAEAIAENVFLQNSWKSTGWESALVRSRVIVHFQNIEARLATTEIQSRLAEATA